MHKDDPQSNFHPTSSLSFPKYFQITPHPNTQLKGHLYPFHSHTIQSLVFPYLVNLKPTNPFKNMSSLNFTPFHQMEKNHALLSLLQGTSTRNIQTSKKSSKPANIGGGLFRIFKLFPMLTTGCKMAALLGSRQRKPLLVDNAISGTLFGYRKGRLTLAIQEDPHRLPIFIIELPISTSAFHKEMGSDVLRIAIESDTKTRKKKLMEEFVWAVYCNGRKIGYSIRRKNMSDDELHVMQLLRGVSIGAGVLPSLSEKETSSEDGELTYIRARFDRVVGSKDSESFYMINPDGASGQEFSIFFVRQNRT